MAYLLDTDAISETLRRRPLTAYITWLATIPSDQLFTSSVSIAELLRGAYKSRDRYPNLLTRIESQIIPTLTILSFDLSIAKVYARIGGSLEQQGQVLAHPDLQIAATALHFELQLVTGNLRHFSRITDLIINSVLADAKASQGQ
ncbi:MAG TPA: PIN domain-containing protein [Chroococcidiopsis sp.]